MIIIDIVLTIGGLLTAFLFFFVYYRSSRIPIMMYHRICDSPCDPYSIAPQDFAKQLEFLKNHGYHTISLRMLYQHLQSGMSLPKKPVVLTFDDGYEDNLIHALPLLNQYEMTATVFIIAGWVGRNNDWDSNSDQQSHRHMTWEQIREWHDNGMEIGSHTYNHCALNQLGSEQEIRSEVCRSKLIIEEKIGSPVEFLCYPYGGTDDRVKKIVSTAGYKLALTIFDTKPLSGIDLYALPREAILQEHPFKYFLFRVWTPPILLASIVQKYSRFLHKCRSFL